MKKYEITAYTDEVKKTKIIEAKNKEEAERVERVCNGVRGVEASSM